MRHNPCKNRSHTLPTSFSSPKNLLSMHRMQGKPIDRPHRHLDAQNTLKYGNFRQPSDLLSAAKTTLNKLTIYFILFISITNIVNIFNIIHSVHFC